MKNVVITLVALACTACGAEPHQKSFVGDRLQHDSGYWTRYNNHYTEDFWVSSTPDTITFHLTNLSKENQIKPIFSKYDIPFFIDAEYKGATVSRFEVYIDRTVGAGENPSPDWILAPQQTASGTFEQEKIAQRYWSDTYLRPVLWRQEATIRFNYNGVVSNPCVVRKKPGAVFTEKWVSNTPAPIYFDCSAPTTPAQRLKDNKKRIPWSKRWDKDLLSYQYQWVG